MLGNRGRFERYLQRWWESELAGSDDPSSWRKDRTTEALASTLRRKAQFEFFQAGYLHRKPHLDSALELVGRLDPAPSAEDGQILAEAIVLAGSTAQRVRATTAAGALVTVLALVVRNVLRGR